ncbi:MAG TPA: class I SAM-dependent methyltransferase, partial [Vicinamibacterales bacterium]
MATGSAAETSGTAGARHGVDRALAAVLQSRIGGAGVGVELWNGVSLTPGVTPCGALQIHDRAALIGLLLDPDIQFGERYADGRLDVAGDFGTVIDALSRNVSRNGLSLRERWAMMTEHAEGLRAARRNIHRHYDIGNDFYRLWLDRDLVYTCAYYPTADADLETAQTAKLDLVCRKVNLRPGDQV